MNKLSVKIKNIYNKDLVYPNCEKSRIFCDLMKTQTFTKNAIELIKKLGFEFEVAQAEKI
jgi:hypothetical protein